MQRVHVAEGPIDGARLTFELAAIAERHAADSPAARKAVLDLLKEVMAHGRAMIRARLDQDREGLHSAERLSALTDTVISALFDFAATKVFQANNPSSAERLSMVAVGGYGRGTLAP